MSAPPGGNAGQQQAFFPPQMAMWNQWASGIFYFFILYVIYLFIFIPY